MNLRGTSSNAECFAPTTGNQEDFIPKVESITALDEDGSEIYIDYDVKLKTYSVL